MARKRGGIYKASRGTLLPAPKRAPSLPVMTWVAIGVFGFAVGWRLVAGSFPGTKK